MCAFRGDQLFEFPILNEKKLPVRNLILKDLKSFPLKVLDLIFGFARLDDFSQNELYLRYCIIAMSRL